MVQGCRVLVHIVTWNSARCIVPCIESVVRQEGFTLGESLVVRVTDNASVDETVERVQSVLRPGVELIQNGANLGFCGGHNQGVAQVRAGRFDALLLLNPDLALAPDALLQMVNSLSERERIGLVTPKLLRANNELRPLEPARIDAAGMYLTRSLRHFDRGSGELDVGQFEVAQEVFGGTGACLLLSRACIEEVVLSPSISERSVHTIYPQLAVGSAERPKLFDEAFFAYREDADLSWRARLLGWRCWYQPQARGFHVRVVVPERRRQLPVELNRYSVRNRFLLQLHNWSWAQGIESVVFGLVLRNLLVVLGVVLLERSSAHALREVLSLLPRALTIRRDIRRRRARNRTRRTTTDSR